jgi:hypothetical protein
VEKFLRRVAFPAILAVALAAVAISVRPGHTSSAGLAVANASTGMSSVSPPQTGAVDTYSASITVGSTQNDLYVWLAARAGRLVRLSLTLSAPTTVSLTTSPQVIAFASGCFSVSPPSNCDAAVNLKGARYVVYGAGSGLKAVTGGYQLSGYFHVRPVTLDQQGIYTVLLRSVSMTNTNVIERD